MIQQHTSWSRIADSNLSRMSASSYAEVSRPYTVPKIRSALALVLSRNSVGGIIRKMSTVFFSVLEPRTDVPEEECTEPCRRIPTQNRLFTKRHESPF